MLYYQIPIAAVSCFEKVKRFIAQKDWGVVLETADFEEHKNGYSILAFAPIIRLKLENGTLCCEGFELANKSASDPFSAMKEILNHYQSKANLELPFTGGFLGYLGYDLGRQLESLPEIAIKDIELPDFAMGFYATAVILDHKRSQLLITGIDGYQQQADDLFNLCKNPQQQQSTNFKLQSDWQSNMTITDYAEKFAKVKNHIIAGDCYQVNLAQRWQAPYQGEPYQAYLLLKEKNEAPFSAYMNIYNHAIISISPERFISASNGFCETRPIKGTRPRSNNLGEDEKLANELLKSEKDQAENVMIVDLLRNDFSKVCKPHSVKVTGLCELESFAAVHHLVSTISGELENHLDNTDLLEACFPGGSITGAPKIRAMEIIEQLEPHRRSAYCGSIGYLSCNGNMDTSISIRTLVCNQKNIYCWAGGGLVIDSVMEQEFQETFQKVSKILPPLTETLIPDNQFEKHHE